MLITQGVTLHRVVDGDTIDIRISCPPDDLILPVRLMHVDAPERGMAGHRGATAALAGLIARSPLTLETQDRWDRVRDRWGRIVGLVWASEDCVNVGMVSHGFARAWRDGPTSRMWTAIESAERTARDNRRGLWGSAPATMSQLGTAVRVHRRTYSGS